MRLWTVQPEIVWEQIQRNGTLSVDESLIAENGYIPWQYRWLAEQLKKRLPDYCGDLPWWAYCEKPDLRWVRHYRPRGQRQVRIELEISQGEAFITPSWAWNTLYGGGYLSFEQTVQDDWMARMQRAVPDEDTWPLPEPWKTELEASWGRLFDPQLPTRSWEQESLFRVDEEREAVFGTIRLEDVRGITLFTGASQR